MRIRSTALLAATAAAATTVIGLAAPANAASDKVYSTTSRSYAAFTDPGDILAVCDLRDGDGRGAVGRVGVQQADGTWRALPWVFAWNGCSDGIRDIAREDAQYRITVCDNFGDGVYANCDSVLVDGR